MLCKRICKKCINKAAGERNPLGWTKWKHWYDYDKKRWDLGVVGCRKEGSAEHSIYRGPPPYCTYKFEHAIAAAANVEV